jgi:NQR2, RnfD, RnfE family
VAARPSPRPAGGASAPPRARGAWRQWLPVRIWKRYFPPVRLVWIFLLLLVWEGKGFVTEAVAWPLLALPLLTAATDVGFQLARYPKLRIPDAGIANGFFLSIILWPTEITLALAAVAVVTVGVRHIVRIGGHPILNPAAVGVTVAATLFALPQPWHLGITTDDTILVLLLGAILWSRAWRTWRLWGIYFVANALTTVLIAEWLGGAAALPYILEVGLFSAAPVFYAMFMVTEPRTAPSSPRAMIVFGAMVGAAAALLPTLFAEYITISALGILAPYLALFAGNGFTVGAAAFRGRRRRVAAGAPRARAAVPARPRPTVAGVGATRLGSMLVVGGVVARPSPSGAGPSRGSARPSPDGGAVPRAAEPSREGAEGLRPA